MTWKAHLMRARNHAGQLAAEEWFCAPSRADAFALARTAWPTALLWEHVTAEPMRPTTRNPTTRSTT